MSLLRVGAGGWAYFQVPGEDSLRAYSRGFDFVEVNSTYYEMPSISLVESWRRRVPSSFEFSVRCNRRLVEQYCSQSATSSPDRKDGLSDIESVCRTLEANVLVILIRVLGKGTISGLNRLLSSFDLKRTRLAVELRGASPSRGFLKVLSKNDAVHVVDISKNDAPAVDSGMLYSRLFGKGEGNVYEFDDMELKQIAEKASSPKFERSILAFHGVRMYRDAARLKAFTSKGIFPNLTQYRGLDALQAVLEEDTVFPATKAELVKSQGWKLFDLTNDRRVRASELLQRLPDSTFKNADEVKVALEGPMRAIV